ncbi:cyclic nucleotide-binding domain-containing protein [Kaistia dalseonensis]|uniref:CRP-like cAMP-binding protein n=1 Tax=Kaistia dalseonensis TaxID=410840 RepID=A0ABU0H515_9HYPH|nr:cyclic nucleotide-binding domain-containing protein [Kaistia dalseonensis]MCX5494806.1 cyclic nucleotide-binding domain-containing protein [Kaistia dalseonensis]MDQ0437387.1 CRP-like cAMP-binding protein [Kaistia dalseonensis]
MTLAEDISLLSRVPLLSDLASDHLRLLAFSGIRLELPAGRILFKADSKALSGFIIMSGEIEMSAHHGETVRSLGKFGPGSLLGETALFVETRRPATATALVDTVVVEIDRTLMSRMLTEYPEVATRLFVRLRQRLGDTVGELAGVHAKLDALHYPELP